MQAQAQSGNANFAFGAIILLFIAYITAKGELGTYLGFFIYSPSTNATPPAATATPVAPNTTSNSPTSTPLSPSQPGSLTNNYFNWLNGSQPSINPNVQNVAPNPSQYNAPPSTFNYNGVQTPAIGDFSIGQFQQ
jgi:hypothetical protein